MIFRFKFTRNVNILWNCVRKWIGNISVTFQTGCRCILLRCRFFLGRQTNWIPLVHNLISSLTSYFINDK